MCIELNQTNQVFTNTHNWQYCQLCIRKYLYFPSLVTINVKLDVSGYKRIIFQGYRLHWFSSFVMAQLSKVGHFGILELHRVCEIKMALNSIYCNVDCEN